MAVWKKYHPHGWSLLFTLVFAWVTALSAQAASYRVFPLPIVGPDHGSRALLIDPHDGQASAFGWHDTDGWPGAEYTTLRGNNVWVFVDADADGMPDGPGPDGGSALLFEHPAAPETQPPMAYADALATNAFYLGNMFHDILWHHGFREGDGNFQQNNYGNGGVGGDPVIIEILRGDGTNNAVPVHSLEGTSPRIRLYEWTFTQPSREASFDATVVGWLYMQLVQHRLLEAGCALNVERPEMGYSDYFAILASTDFLAATPSTPRGLATWLMGQPIHGAGLRDVAYSTDMSINPLTYADSVTMTSPYAIGAIWASALWDLTWLMVGREGASGTLFNGDGGENRALRLAVESLKQQVCHAGLVDARDSVLIADAALYGGAYRCEIWSAFARRGLGASAVQGTSDSNADNVAAFDLPSECDDTIFSNGFELPTLN